MNAKANKEREFLSVLKRAHKNGGLFKESKDANHGIWLKFIFESDNMLSNFSHVLQADNLGKCMHLGGKGSKEINVLI